MLKFNRKYFLIFIIVLLTEIMIALFVRDNFIRPYLGDALVIILIYCFIKAFSDFAVLPAVLLVLTFSFLIEFLQYLNFLAAIGLEQSMPVKMILGNSFSWEDIIMYLIGAAMILIVEKVRV